MKMSLLLSLLGIWCVCQAQSPQTQAPPDDFRIVEPFPEDIYPFEFSSANVTCVAFDSLGKKIPKNITFMRRVNSFNFQKLMPNKNLYFTNRTEMQGNKTKLFATMHIRNVTMDYDSDLSHSGYECRAFAVGDSVEGGYHIFDIAVIRNDELPKVVLGYDINSSAIHCVIFESDYPNSTSWERLSLLKDDVVLNSVQIFGQLVSSQTLLLRLDKEERYNGNYTCLLQVRLRNRKPHNVSDGSFTEVKVPRMMCYRCQGSGQTCRNETFLKNSRAQKICKVDENRCGWIYQRINMSFEIFAMDCLSQVICEEVTRKCEQAMNSGLLECCDLSCCESNFCNKLKHSDGRLCRKRPNLVAAIFGGAVVIRGVKENLTMNGSLSYDPETGSNKGMNFTWHYGTIPGIKVSSLQLNEQASFTAINTSSIKYFGKGSGPVITIDTDLLNDNETIIVILNVTKGYRNSGVFQVVFLSGGEPPRLSQRCVINCGPTAIPSVKLSTESICQGSQCSNIESYDWTLYEEDQPASNSSVTVWQKRSDLPLIASTPLNSSVIVIKENSLVGGGSYRLAVSVQSADGFPGMSVYDISTAFLPLDGECSIQPASGIALKTYFNLSCSGWKSNNGPLSYQFQYQLKNGLNRIIFHGLNNSFTSQLPSGDLADNYTLNMTVTVADKNGASAPVVNTVQVIPPKNINSETTDRLILAEDSLLNEAIKIGDLSGAVQIANNVLQTIVKAPSLDKREKTKIQELIVAKIVKLPVKSLPDLVQSSSVIGSATQDTDTVSVKSLFTSLSAVKSMTSLLNTKAQAKNTIDVPLIAKSAENLGSCLNNMLKAGAQLASRNLDSAQGIDVVTQSMQLVNNVSDAVLELHLPDEEQISIRTSGMTFVLGRHTPAKLAGFRVESGDGKFVLPADMDFRFENTSFVDTQMLSIPFNPFTWDITSQRVHSNVLSLDLKSDKRRIIKVSQLSSDILITIPLKHQDKALEKPRFFTKNGTSRFHEINIDYENTLMQLEITTEEINVNLTIFMRFGHRPTIKEHDLNGTVSSGERCIWTKPQGRNGGKQVCSPNALTPIEIFAQKPGKYYLEVRSHKSFSKPQKRQKRSCLGHGRQKRSCVEIKSPPPTPPQRENVSIVPVYDPSTDNNYNMQVALGSCVYWSDERQMWTTQGCQVLSGNVNGFINCSCNHLTPFGGSLLVKPNPIDFDKVLVEFKKIDETGNVAVIVTIAVVFMIYFVVVIIVRPADRKHAARMSGNTRQHLTSSSNACEYEVTITTGIWRNAGTTANVALEIYGSERSTGILQLTFKGESDYAPFYRGSSEVFVLPLEQPLGCVRGVRIGHDNSGTAPSWFLEDVVILETQTMNSWKFSNNQWLALERGDGRIERMLQASTNKSGFSRDVWIRWLNGLTKKHIWVSVLTKPSRDRFSRMQRASCCLSVLLSAMLANAMFYELNRRPTPLIQVGPLKFSWRQVIVGIQSALIVAPINILIAFMFEKGSLRTSDQQQPGSTLRKWLVFLAWFLCFCTCAVSAVFTIFYSLVWEKTISEQWLSSMFISFLQDVTLTEPTKIFVTAVVLATIVRRRRRKSDGYLSLEQNDNVSSKERLWKMEISDVEDMRKRQAKKQNISRFFVELFVYCVFITVLMVVCYGNKNDHRYFMTKSIRDSLPRFHEVFSNEKYWVWLRAVFVPGVYAGTWYNGLREDQSIYIGDKKSVLVGMPRVRQLRVKPKPCDVLDYMKTTFPTCNYAYSKENEDTTPYNKPGWIAVENSTKKDELNRLCPKPWRYQKSAETDTVPKWGQFSFYPGGGFVADLGYEKRIGLDIIETLQRHGWLDLQTRPVILEFSAFNPPTNLLVVSTYFYEILPSGFKAPFERIKTISVYSKETGSHQFYLICILLFILLVLLYMGRILYSIYKQGRQFFKTFWNWVETFQVVFSVLAVAMNIVRSSEALSTIRKTKANLYANVNFQEVIAWIEAENGVLGILVFLVTLKLLRLIRYNKQVAVFSKTLKVSAKLLLSFMVVFVVVFMAFMHFGILIFGMASEKYSTLLKATYFQLELTLGRVKARPINELTDANDTFGRIFTSFLLLSLTIIFMNFFIAAINDALLNVKNSVNSNELYDLVEELGTKNGEEHKKLFDVISKYLRQKSKIEKPSVKRNNDLEKHTKTSVDKAAVDFDSISKAIVALRQKRKQESSQEKPESMRRKSLYDRVSIAVKQFKRTLFTRDVTRSQLKKLSEKEEVLIERLENIVQAECDEEETFELLCHQA